MVNPEIPSMMLAAQVVGYSQEPPYTIQKAPVPQIEPHQLLIKVHAAGFCHTDAMVLEGRSPLPLAQPLPLTGSHEPAGVVVRVGQDVTDFQVGDRVGSVASLGSCLTCDVCLEVDPKHCPNRKGSLGLTHNGGFAEYCAVAAASCAIIPDSISYEQAAPLCCAGTTIHCGLQKATRVANLRPGDLVGIVGLGGLGLLGIQMAKAMASIYPFHAVDWSDADLQGYTVVGVDARSEPLEVARSLSKLGADLLIQSDTSSEDALAQIKRLVPRATGLKTVLVATDAPSASKYALDILASNGTFMLLGQPEVGVTFPYQAFVLRNITVVGDRLGMGPDLKECFDLCAKHAIRSSIATYDFQDINRAVHALHEPGRKGKAVIRFA